jgi:hypothetical protein
MSLVAKAQTAVENPAEIPPYLRGKVRGVARHAATGLALRTVPSQYRLLEQLRDGDDWLLVVLDACRYDALAGQFHRYFEGEVSAVRAAGRDTFEYVRECWPGQHDVTYVSGATPINSSDEEYEADGFAELYGGYTPTDHLFEIVDVWESGWDASLGTCPPWAVTDAALARRDESQLVAHFFQPHAPYIGEERLVGHTNSADARPFQGAPVDSPIWQGVKSGEVSDERLRAAYQANLDAALREVARLVDGVGHDGIVLMGDHGEALGEFGTYAHPRVEHPQIRKVPWARVEGLTEIGEAAAERAGGEMTESPTGTVADRLEALGYR